MTIIQRTKPILSFVEALLAFRVIPLHDLVCFWYIFLCLQETFPLYPAYFWAKFLLPSRNRAAATPLWWIPAIPAPSFSIISSTTCHICFLKKREEILENFGRVILIREQKSEFFGWRLRFIGYFPFLIWIRISIAG